MYSMSPLSIYCAQQVVQWAPLIQKSIEPLDISLCEYTRIHAAMPSTRKGYLKVHENPVVSTFNLDSHPNIKDYFFRYALEKSLYLYDTNFAHFLPRMEVDICRWIKRSKHICVSIDRFLKPVELLGLCSGVGIMQIRAIQTCNMFLNLLVKSCENADHAIQVMRKLHEMCNSKRDLTVYFFMDNTKKSVDYVFRQVQKTRCDVFGLLSVPNKTDIMNQPVLQSFCKLQFKLVLVLLYYGVCVDFETAWVIIGGLWIPEGFRIFFFGPFYNRLSDAFDNPPLPLPKRVLPILRRQVQVMQIIFCGWMRKTGDYLANKATDCLRMIWRSIPDTFISNEDFLLFASSPWVFDDHTLYPGADYTTLMELYKWYEHNIVGRDVLCSQPRSLLQYSRCVVRRQLARNCNLPGGIQTLGLSNALESYLRLEW